jgi:hypothetical protein
MKLTSIGGALLASAFLLQGCGSNDDPPEPKIGVFLDSPVRFIDYTTKNTAGNITREDQTNAEGQYEYTEGETVTFSIGALMFPPVKATGVVTPLDIADTDNPNDTKAVNMVRLLQTLDQDGDPSNGITITETAKAAASQVVSADPEVNVFSLTESEFVASVDSLVKDGGQDTPVTELVSTEQAVTHFEETLTENNVTFDPVDGTPPVITVLGDNPATVTQDDSYTDVGATARDDVDGMVLVTTSGSVDTSTVGAYTLTYSAMDAIGNSVESTRTVNVVAPDTTAPVITLTGESTITLTQNDSFTDAGATASDNVDSNVTVITSGTVDTSAIGTYTLTYSATDAAGNEAAEVIRTVNIVAVIVVDTTAPVITLSGASEVTVTRGDSYTDAGATATDNIDSSVAVTVSGSVDTSTAGTYTLTYTAKDTANNAAAAVTRTITVVEPANIPPTADAGDDQSGIAGFSVTLEGSGSDDDGTIESYLWSEGNVEKGNAATLVLDDLAAGVYTFTLTVTDDRGGEASDSVEVTVSSIHGSWLLPDGTVTINILPDGRYFATSWDDFGVNDQGFEYGTYIASETEITFTTLQNQDGDRLTCGEDRGTNCTGENGTEKGVWGYMVDEDSLTISPRGENITAVLNRIRPSNSSAEFDGFWESLDAKEFVLFWNGNFIYVDYLSEGFSGETIMDIGFYELTGNTDGTNSEVNLTSNITYNDQGRNFCDDCSGTFYYDVVNKQLVAIDSAGGENGAAGRGYFNNVFDDVPANTGRLVAQKNYASDVLANQVHGLEINDEYRTSIETPNLYQLTGTEGNSVSVKLNIDEATNVVRESDGSAGVEARLYMLYKIPSLESGIDVSLRFRSRGGSPSAKYAINRCIDNNCDNEGHIEGFMSDFAGDYAGDHTMSISWDDATEEFVFVVDEKTARMKISDYTQDSRVIAAGGHDFDTNQYAGFRMRAEVKDVENVGESAYIKVHVDEVKFNDEVYDDFSNGLIDDRKWVYRGEER